MRTRIHVTGIEQTPAIEKYVSKALTVLGKVVGDDEAAKIEMEVGKSTKHHRSGIVFFAQVDVHITRKNFRAVAEAEDLYVAIDQAKHEMHGQVTAHHDKRRAVGKKGKTLIKKVLKGQVTPRK